MSNEYEQKTMKDEEEQKIPLAMSQPAKRGRGRPVLFHSRSAERPRKLNHSTRESCSTQNNDDDREGLPEEDMDDDDEFMEYNLTITYDPVTWQEAKQSKDVEAWRLAMEIPCTNWKQHMGNNSKTSNAIDYW